MYNGSRLWWPTQVPETLILRARGLFQRPSQAFGDFGNTIRVLKIGVYMITESGGKERVFEDPAIGTVFNRLTVISASSTDTRQRTIDVRCECGTVKTVLFNNLRTGKSKSCGCLRAERRVSCNTTHGMRDTPEYERWAAMLARCRNVNNSVYDHYGARGIVVCPEWNSFETFYRDMGAVPFEGATLERIDSNGNYEKGNVIWADRATQSNNKNSSVRFEYRGQKYSLAELSDLSGINKRALSARLYSHSWSVAAAVETPLFSRSGDERMKSPATRHKLYPQP